MTSTENATTTWPQRGNSTYDSIAAVIGEEVRAAALCPVTRASRRLAKRFLQRLSSIWIPVERFVTVVD